MVLISLVALVAATSDAPAADYPKVVHRDGNVCVQELDATGAVTESCRPERGVGLASARPSAQLLPGGVLDDPKGSTRGIAELSAGIVGATLPLLIIGATSQGLPTVTSALLGGMLSMVVAGAASWILHSIFEGQAGIGWAVLGALAGSVAATLVGLVMTGLTAVGIMTTAVLGVLLPALGASIALEARDGAFRRGEVATFGPRPQLLVASF